MLHWCVARDTSTVCRNLWDYQLHSQTVPSVHTYYNMYVPYVHTAHINNTVYPLVICVHVLLGPLTLLVLA